MGESYDNKSISNNGKMSGILLFVFKKIIQILGAGVVSLVILSMFSLIYYFSGLHIENNSGATDYKWPSGQWRATMKEGFAWFKMDENGFNNIAYDDIKNQQLDILLMGSSNMEAVQVSTDENTGYLLNSLAPNYSTYNIGMSGHRIYTCVNNLQSAMTEYAPSQYIILETGNVCLDTETMLQVINGEYECIESYDSGILYLLQKYIPAIKNIYKAIDEWRSLGNDEEETNSEIAVDILDNQDLYSRTLNAFLQKAAADANGKLVIFYHPETYIDETGTFMNNDDEEYNRKLFASACDKVGIKFIDMTDDFKKLYEEEHILAHGFTNTAVGVGHLNKYGHRVIAERLVDELNLTED